MHSIQPLPFLPFMLVPVFFMAMFLVFFLLMFAGTIFWIWMIVDCVQNEPATGNDKIVWLLLLLFTHFVGAVIYFFARRGPRRRQLAGLPAIPQRQV
jgi:hypothetical protein